MGVTVGPGVYWPSWGGVGIEGDVVVTGTGRGVLTGVSRGLGDCVVA